MFRGLIAAALICGSLVGCASPGDSFSAASSDPIAFSFVAESYDLYPTRRFEGEARRLQDLQQYLASRGLCADGYMIDSREEAVDGGSLFTKYFQGDIFSVTYTGHCSRPGEMPAMAPTRG